MTGGFGHDAEIFRRETISLRKQRDKAIAQRDQLLEACRAMVLELQYRRDMIGGLTGAELDALDQGQTAIRAAEGEGEGE